MSLGEEKPLRRPHRELLRRDRRGDMLYGRVLKSPDMKRLLPLAAAFVPSRAPRRTPSFGGDTGPATRSLAPADVQGRSRPPAAASSELAMQNEQMRRAGAPTMGQIELRDQRWNAKQRQKDFYVDLDARLPVRIRRGCRLRRPGMRRWRHRLQTAAPPGTCPCASPPHPRTPNPPTTRGASRLPRTASTRTRRPRSSASSPATRRATSPQAPTSGPATPPAGATSPVQNRPFKTVMDSIPRRTSPRRHARPGQQSASRP